MSIRLMSSNIWGDYFENEVAVRDRQLESIYRKYLPDVLGLQEMTQSWWNSPIWKDLEDEYQFVPISTNGELHYTPMMYKSSRVKVMDSGWYLYHAELDRSKGYTWAVFCDGETQKHFAVFNTHFMWTASIENSQAYDTIRRYNAMELCYAMEKISKAYDCPVFFMGDLNCEEDSLAWKFLNEKGWYTSYEIAMEYSEVCTEHGDPKRGEDGFYHGNLTEEGKESSIDHIGIKKETIVLRQVAVTDQAALDATDHTPVYADIVL